MADKLVEFPRLKPDGVNGYTLAELAFEIRSRELRRALKDLRIDGTQSIFVYQSVDRTPRRDIVLLPSPAVPPADAVEICEGPLFVFGAQMTVTAFRLPATPET